MKNRFLRLIVLLAISFGLSGCGTDKQESTNNAANEYFSSFINSVDGQRTGQKLYINTTGIGTTSGGTISCGFNTSGQFGITTELVLDSNRTYIVYQNNSNVNQFGFGGFNQPQPNTNAENLIKVADGEWRIEGSRLILDGFGSTGDFGASNFLNGNTQFGQNFFASNGFNMQPDSGVNFTTSTFGGFNGGGVSTNLNGAPISVCRQ